MYCMGFGFRSRGKDLCYATHLFFSVIVVVVVVVVVVGLFVFARVAR